MPAHAAAAGAARTAAVVSAGADVRVTAWFQVPLCCWTCRTASWYSVRFQHSPASPSGGRTDVNQHSVLAWFAGAAVLATLGPHSLICWCLSASRLLLPANLMPGPTCLCSLTCSPISFEIASL
jgi:hypothetical protein